MSTAGAGRPAWWWWRRAIAIVSAAEASAFTVWLLPASIHIVQWPASGPVRLALLPPAWQLGVYCAVALVVALGLISIQRGRIERLASLLMPISLLWLTAVPYLPWLPDRAPLLLVLAGPLRWPLVIAAVIAAVLRGAAGRVALPRVPRFERRTVFVASLVVYLVFGLYAVRTNGLGGDEPHYLIITESLLRDGDLQIENNHQRGDYRPFFAGNLRPDFLQRGKNGEIYSIHAPGLPALLLPAYAIAGRTGAVAMLCLIAALTALAVFDLAGAIAGPSAAILTWVAVCFTVPFVPHSWLIFPEMPGALLVAWAACWLWQSVDVSSGRWAARGGALALLPWLHTKFIVFLGVFAAALALRLWRRWRSLASFATPIAISCALWLYSFYAMYGAFDPEAPYGAYTRIYVLTRNIPHGLLGIFFDQKFGLFFYSPIYLAAIAGGWLLLKRDDSRFLGAVLLIVTALFVGSTARLYMFWGGSSAPARFLVPLLPCLAPMVAVAIARAQGAASRALIGLSMAIGLALAMAGAGWPARLMLFSDPHGRARILEAVQGGSPLALVVPTFTDPDWPSHVASLWAWLAVAALSVIVVAVAARFGKRSSCSLAGVACLVFLLGGAVVSARPDGAVRDATALRGALDVIWRFDGTRFRTLDYETLGRATHERRQELTTLVLTPDRLLQLPAGTYEAVVWFASSRPRQGEVIVAAAPEVIFGRTSGALQNPVRVPFDLPVAVRRLSVRVPDETIAAGISRIEIVPQAVVPPGQREAVAVRVVESIQGRPGAYLAYTDEHAYPEGGIFWSRGTAETALLMAPGGASRAILTLSTGPMSGDVVVSVAGKSQHLSMSAGREAVVAFDLPPAERLVPVTVQSTVMFRPAEVDTASTDMRGLGCQVRIALE